MKNYFFDLVLVSNTGEERNYQFNKQGRWGNYTGFLAHFYSKLGTTEKAEIDILMPITESLEIMNNEKAFLKAVRRIKKDVMMYDSTTGKTVLLDEEVFNVYPSRVTVCLSGESNEYTGAYTYGRFIIEEDK